MKKLFIDDELKGDIKKITHNSVTGMWLFVLDGADVAGIAIRDDEIFAFATSTSFGGDVNILTNTKDVPDGYDADCYGERFFSQNT